MTKTCTRRTFVAAGAACLAAPALFTQKRLKARERDEVIIGDGDYRFRADHSWCQLPDRFRWQTTHNVAVDSQNQLYVIHEGERQLKDHPAIFVFDASGKFVRAFGAQFQGGGHGLEIRREGGEEFLYVAAYQQVKSIAKLTTAGEIVWYLKAPIESGIYDEREQFSTEPNWSRRGFLPTNFAFLEDGGFLLADGYGSYCIHRFDRDGKWLSHFGGAGEGQGTFDTPHGLCVDQRPDRMPSIVVTDRAHGTLQRFDMQGRYIETIAGFGLPANLETRGNLLLVPELKAQVTLLDKQDQIVARLGTGTQRLGQIEQLRGKPDQWKDGEFIHPHDACFDAEGNIFVAEWVRPGRVTKLSRIP